MAWTKDNHPKGGRPPAPPGQTLHIKFPNHLVRRLDEIAAAWSVTRSEALRRLVEAVPHV